LRGRLTRPRSFFDVLRCELLRQFLEPGNRDRDDLSRRELRSCGAGDIRKRGNGRAGGGFADVGVVAGHGGLGAADYGLDDGEGCVGFTAQADA